MEKTVVVTGSGRGIGLSIAHGFLATGHNVVLSDVDREQLSLASRQLASEFGEGRVLSQVCDVRKKEDVESLAGFAVEHTQSLDVWINNAGLARDTLLIRMKDADWDEVYDVNLKGAFYGIQAAGKIMLKARSGSIVNIGSVSGYYGNAGQANYSSAKAALMALTKSAAREFAGRGVRVNTVAAGFIDNDFAAHLPREIKEELLGRIPLKYQGDPTDYVARAVAFLASEDAGFITGAMLRVDGGMAIGF